MKLALLVKTSRKTEQQLCDADGVVMSLFLCFPTCVYFFVEGNRDPTTSGLQSYLETDENDGVVLTAKDGTKWKKIQVNDQSTGRHAGQNILGQCPGPASYVRRNIQTGSPASAWHLLLRRLHLNTSGKAPSLKLHCCYVREE